MIKRAFYGFLGSQILAFTVFANVGAAHAAWADNNCIKAGPLTYNGITRADAISYAVTANGDGYEWGGGCWNQNGVDDTPGAPDSHGEGADCSGFTFKTWKLPLNMGAPVQTYHHWVQWNDEHGPYTSADFRSGVGIPRTKAKAYGETLRMDAFASTTHIGMVYAEGSSGYDTIIEAKGDSAGTGIWSRGYRSDPAYGGVGRGGWG